MKEKKEIKVDTKYVSSFFEGFSNSDANSNSQNTYEYLESTMPEPLVFERNRKTGYIKRDSNDKFQPGEVLISKGVLGTF